MRRAARQRVSARPMVLAASLMAAASWGSPAVAATIDVTSPDDPAGGAGTCTLRQAVTAANTNAATGGCTAGDDGADTIWLMTDVTLVGAAGDDSNLTGDLDIDNGAGTGPKEDLTITGVGSQRTIDANQLDRVLHILSTSQDVTLQNLTIKNGLTAGTATSENGGGIYNGGGKLTLSGVTLTANATGAVTALSGFGGAIFSVGDVVISGSRITDNHTGNSSGTGTNDGSGTGGGISSPTRTVTVTDSTISGNETGGASKTSGSGGGISAPAIVLTRTLVSDNRTGDGGTSGDGGGLYQFGGPLTVTDSAFVGNGTGAAGTTRGSGGAILGVQSASTSALTRSTFDTNDAFRGGALFSQGGLIAVGNSTFRDNAASDRGGAIGNARVSSTFTGNTAIDFSTFSGNTATTSGAALARIGTSPNQGAITLARSLIDSTATNSCEAGVDGSGGGNITSDAANGCPGDVGTVGLGAFGDHGGPRIGFAQDQRTGTFPLLASSVAVDHATCGATTMDQTGQVRPQGAACDSGSLEALFAPVFTASPVVSGTPAVGSPLACSDGAHSGTEPIAITRQWRRGGVAIAGATAASYTPTAADAGMSVDCVVAATNGAGSPTATSNAVVIAAPPTTGTTGTGGTVPDLGDDPTTANLREVVLDRTRVNLELGCPAGAPADCTFTLNLTTKSRVATSSAKHRRKAKRKRVKLATARRTVKPGQIARLRPRLTRGGRRVMRRRTRIAATLTLTRTINATKQTAKRTVIVRKLPTVTSVRNAKTRLRIPFASATDPARNATVILTNRRTTLATATTRPSPGRSRTVTLKLTKAGRKQLAHRRRVTLTVTTTDTTGTRHTLTTKLTAGPPRHR